MRRGYLLSLLMILLFYSLLQFTYQSVSIRNQNRDIVFKQFYVEKTEYLIDDMVGDIRNVLKLDTPANSTFITFTENMSINRTTFFNNYVQFVGNYSNVSNSNISFGYNNPLNISFSNGFVLTSNLARNRTDFYNVTGGPPAVNRYEVIIIGNDTRSGLNFPTYIPSSNLYILVNYTDAVNPNKNFVEQGYVNPNVLNTVDIKFGASKSIMLYFGLVNGRNNSYAMEQVDILAVKDYMLIVNRTSKSGLYANYNIPVNITVGDAAFRGNLPAN